MDEATEVTAPETTDTGQVEGAAPAETQETQTPPESFDWSPYGDQQVELTVRGEKVYKPLRDVVNGAMMQEDYTRSKQEIAAEREAVNEARTIQAALENNPAEAIRILDEIYETGLFGQTTQEPTGFEETLEEPQDEWRGEVDSFIKDQRLAQAEARIETQLDFIEKNYDPNVDRDAVVQHALKTNNFDLVDAYKAMAFETVRQARVAEQERADQEAQDRKKKDAVVDGGRGLARGATTATPPEGFQSIADAYKAAQEAHGRR